MTEQEIKQHAEDFHKSIEKIEAMSDEVVDNLIKADQCPYEPEHLLGVPIGMFHCPLCNEMVIASVPHPRQHPEWTEEELAHMAEIAGAAEKVKIESIL